MFKTSNPHRHHGRGVPTHLFPMPGQKQRFLPFTILGIVWRWRWEAITLFAVYVIYSKLDRVGHSTVVIVFILVGTLAIVLLVPVTRRFVLNRVWCVTDRHRLRVCMNELRTYNYSGRSAFILAARANGEGEAIWLWLRPGLSVEHLQERTEAIAAACWARDARVGRSPKLAALVRVDILRRDPLARTHIESPLLATTRHLPDGEANPLRAFRIIRGGLDTEGETDTTTTTSTTGATHAPATAASAPKASTALKASTKSTSPATATSVLPVISRTGEDVSDYV